MTSTSSHCGKAVRICVVEEHALAKTHLKLILCRDKAFRVSEVDFHNLKSSLRLAPDVFVLSHLHASSLPSYLKLIQHSAKHAKTLLIGSTFRPTGLMSLLRSGVYGFVQDEEVETDLITAIHNLVQGRVWIRAQYFTPSEKARPTESDLLSTFRQLTPQQSRVVELVRDNFSNKQIAAELGISERTVKFHLQNIFLSLRVSNRHEISEVFLQGRALQVQPDPRAHLACPSRP